MDYTELQVTTNFSFLRGGSHPEEIIEQAVALGYREIAITDRNTLAGIVRAHVAARGKAIRFIPGCRLDLLDGPSLLAYPTDKEAYARLSAILTKGNLRAEKGACHLYKKDVYERAKGLKLIVLPPDKLDGNFEFDPGFAQVLNEYKEAFGPDLYLGARFSYSGNDQKLLFRLSQLADQMAIPMVAANDVHYHAKERRELQDILTCIREKCTIQEAGFRLHANAERYLKPIEEMHRLFREYPDAILRTKEIAEALMLSCMLYSPGLLKTKTGFWEVLS